MYIARQAMRAGWPNFSDFSHFCDVVMPVMNLCGLLHD